MKAGIVHALSNMNWELVLRYWEATRWPLVVLFAFVSFRKVVAYLFLSLREFNFFGTKGELRDVQVVIREKAQELYERERKEGEIVQKQAEQERELESVRGEKGQLYEFASQLLQENQTLERNLTKAMGKRSESAGELQAQISVLLNQIAALQRQISSGPVGGVSEAQSGGGRG